MLGEDSRRSFDGGHGPVGSMVLDAPEEELTRSLQPWGRIGRRRSMIIAAAGLGGIVLAGLFAPLIVAISGAPAPELRDTSSLSATFGVATGPSGAHWFGVDQLGRDVFSRTFYGTRVSILVAVSATAITLLLGVTMGLIAGYRGGWVDAIVSRLIETVLVIPYLLLAVGIAAACSTEAGCFAGTVKPGIPLVVLVISIASWPSVARIVRGQTLTIRESDFVMAARLSGASEGRILMTEVLPNLWGPITVLMVVLVPQVILAEAALSFLGVGVPTATASWGGMIAEAATLFPSAWWCMLFPGVALLATVLASTILADGFRDRNVPAGSSPDRVSR